MVYLQVAITIKYINFSCVKLSFLLILTNLYKKIFYTFIGLIELPIF